MARITVPAALESELNATGLDWYATPGKGGHAKLFLAGRMVGVFHNSRRDSYAGRGLFNVRSQIRNAAKQVKEKAQ